MKFEELPQPENLGKSDNLMGRKFGNLTALYKVPTKDSKYCSFWACYCDCGEYCIKRSDMLKNGTSTICDIHNHNSLVGQRFGHLIVIEKLDKYSKKHGWQYKCLCDCGNLEPIFTWHQYLMSGYPQSCGCSSTNMIDLTNQKFGMLTALELVSEKTASRGLIWKCECECGKKINVPSKFLLSGECISCGTHNISKGEFNMNSILLDNNIEFIHNKSFNNCRFPDTNSRARFDFYLKQTNELIEFDGKQHFEKSKISWNDPEHFVKLHNHDLFKNQWAWENNIPIKRIPYSERDKLNINRILSDEFLITPMTHSWWYPPKDSSYPYFTLEDIDKLKEVS